MPSLPFLVSLMVEKARSRNNQAQNVEDNVRDAFENEEPREHRIDVQEDDESEPTRASSSRETKFTTSSPQEERRQCSRSLVAHLLTPGFTLQESIEASYLLLERSQRTRRATSACSFSPRTNRWMRDTLQSTVGFLSSAVYWFRSVDTPPSRVRQL